MTLREFAERIIARAEKLRQMELEAFTSVVLEHSTYAKRVGAAKAYQKMIDEVEAEYRNTGRQDSDEGEEGGE